MPPTPLVDPPPVKVGPLLPARAHPRSGRLDDRVALVTGGDSGIGRAVCSAFASEGATVAIHHVECPDAARETRRSVERAGRSAHAISADLGDEAGCRRLVERTIGEFGRIDILVNNAVRLPLPVERLEQLDPERIERTFRTSVLSMFHLVRYALPYMRSGSVVINVGSIQDRAPHASLDQAAAEGAIVAFTKSLALELVPREIRVNCVALGPADAPELASAFVFLASGESSYVSGEVLAATGGKPLA
jgi:NAD(P)-dependent dehydrogenase (short-subunit alcohol dehydrogenase family)